MKTTVTDVLIGLTSNLEARAVLYAREWDKEMLPGDDEKLKRLEKAIGSDVYLLCELYQLGIQRQKVGAFLKGYFAIEKRRDLDARIKLHADCYYLTNIR